MFFRAQTLQWMGVGFAVLLGFNQIITAGTIRHDDIDGDGNSPDDHLYTDLALNYPEAGRSFHLGTACSGTLIGGEWWLTAAHCVDGNTVPSDITVNINGNSFGADRIDIHSDWGSGGDPGDVAVVHLDEQVRDTPTALLNRSWSEQGATVTLAGFGRTGTGLTGSNQGNNTKRAGQNVIDTVQNNRVMKVDFDRPNSSTPNALGSATPLMLEILAGPGDSGSGWFMERNGERRVAGVHSGGRDTDGDGTPNDYGDVDNISQVSGYADWIDDQVTASQNKRFWLGLSSTDYNNDTAWISGDAPTVIDTAVYAFNGTRTVHVRSDGHAYRSQFRAGLWTIDLHANTLVAGVVDRGLQVGIVEGDDTRATFTDGNAVASDIRIADLKGSVGAVVVDGPNASLQSGVAGDDDDGQLQVGLSGNGTLRIQNGGRVETQGNFSIGSYFDGDGFVELSGTDTLLDVDGDLVVGEFGRGTMFFNGPKTEARIEEDIYVGDEPSANGTLTLDGEDTRVELDDLVVGHEGAGVVTILTGAAMIADSVDISNISDGDGDLTLIGDAAALVHSGSISVGRYAHGSLTISLGAHVTTGGNADVGLFGDAPNNPSSVHVIGSSSDRASDWSIGGELVVGYRSDHPGEVFVEQAAELDVAEHTTIGNRGTGKLTVDSNASATFHDDLRIAYEADSELNIRNGASVQVSNTTLLGRSEYDYSEGQVVHYVADFNMDGGTLHTTGLNVDSSSVFEFRYGFVDGRIVVGEDGMYYDDVDLHIDGGFGDDHAQLDLIHGGETRLDDGGQGLIVGNGSNGTLGIYDGSLLEVEHATFGWTDDANGVVNVHGAVLDEFDPNQSDSSRLLVTDDTPSDAQQLVVGRAGRGELNVEYGGYVLVDDDMRVARFGESIGRVAVEGVFSRNEPGEAASRLEVMGDLYVAHEPDNSSPFALAGGGDGSMRIEDGGRVHVEGDTRVGATLADNAALQIFNGHLETGSLAINGGATFTFLGGSLTVDGGPVTGLAGQTFALGPVFAGTEGHLLHLKNGASMALNNDESMIVGQFTRGTLRMDSGSTLNTGRAIVGQSAPLILLGAEAGHGLTDLPPDFSTDLPPDLHPDFPTDPIFPLPLYNGVAHLDGDNTQWEIHGDLDIGTPRDGAEPPETPGVGLVTVTNDATLHTTQSVVVNGGSLLQLDNGRVEADGDGVILAPSVGALGEPITDPSMLPGAAGGTGRIVGDLLNLGQLRPGNSPGTLEVDGHYLQEFNVGDSIFAGMLGIQVGDANHDLLAVTGDATLGGTLDVSLYDDPTFYLGDTFTFLTAQSINGTFDSTLLPSLPGLLQFDVQYLSDAIDLTVIPEPTTLALLAPGVLILLRRRKPMK